MQLLIDWSANVNLRSAKYGNALMTALKGRITFFLRSDKQSKSCQSLAGAFFLSGLKSFINTTSVIYNVDGVRGHNKFWSCEQIVQTLLDHGAEVDIDIRSFGNALHLASYLGNEIIFRHVLKRISDVNVFGGYFGSSLLAALEGGHLVIVELFLDCNIDVNHSSSKHGTALGYACAHGMKRLVQTLLDHGADVNEYDAKYGSLLIATIESLITGSSYGSRLGIQQNVVQ